MSILERKLDAGEFVVTAELPVIDGGGVPEIIRQLAPMKAYVDAFNATDNPSAHARCSPLAVSIGMLQAGVEPVMQLTCRDRNRLALQSELLGAAMHGIENICCLTGDDVTAGDEPEARRVFDLDGPQLVALTTTMNEGVTCPGGQSSRGPTSWWERSRTRARRHFSSASAAPPTRLKPEPASCSCSSATGPSCSSGSCAPQPTPGSASGSR